MSNVPAVNELQAKLTAVMEELDHKVFRPQQVRRLARRPRVPRDDRGRSARSRARVSSFALTLPPTPPRSDRQKTAFLCQAKCTDMKGPQEELHRCLEQCGQPIARHEASVMSELQQFQGRVQRCVAQCQDRQRGQTDSAKYDKCISECAVFYQKELAQLKPKLMKKP